jgi:hypothetical protein
MCCPSRNGPIGHTAKPGINGRDVKFFHSEGQGIFLTNTTYHSYRALSLTVNKFLSVHMVRTECWLTSVAEITLCTPHMYSLFHFLPGVIGR